MPSRNLGILVEHMSTRKKKKSLQRVSAKRLAHKTPASLVTLPEHSCEGRCLLGAHPSLLGKSLEAVDSEAPFAPQQRPEGREILPTCRREGRPADDERFRPDCRPTVRQVFLRTLRWRASDVDHACVHALMSCGSAHFLFPGWKLALHERCHLDPV